MTSLYQQSNLPSLFCSALAAGGRQTNVPAAVDSPTALESSDKKCDWTCVHFHPLQLHHCKVHLLFNFSSSEKTTHLAYALVCTFIPTAVLTLQTKLLFDSRPPYLSARLPPPSTPHLPSEHGTAREQPVVLPGILVGAHLAGLSRAVRDLALPPRPASREHKKSEVNTHARGPRACVAAGKFVEAWELQKHRVALPELLRPQIQSTPRLQTNDVSL